MIRFGKYIEYGLSKGYPAKDYMTLFPIPPEGHYRIREVLLKQSRI